MYVKQISIFVENRKGRLEDVCTCLDENGINIKSIILADTNEYGLIRMIVSDVDKAKSVLKEAGFSTIITNVVAIKFPHTKGMLKKLLEIFAEEELNIEYMYGLSTTTEEAIIVFKTSDNEKAVRLIENKGGEYGITTIEESNI